MALGAEITAKRMYQAPIQVQWLTDNRPAHATAGDHSDSVKSSSQFTKSQNAAFEAFQAEVLRRCEAA